MRAALDASDGHLRPWIPFMRQEPRTLDGTCDELARFREDWDAGRVHRWALYAEVLVGEVMLIRREASWEVGYWLHVDHCGRGYATEAVQAVLPLVDGPKLFRCDERNTGSIAVPRKLGAALTGLQTVEGGVVLELWSVN